MALKDDNDRYSLRSAIQTFLDDNIPKTGLVSGGKSGKYYEITSKTDDQIQQSRNKVPPDTWSSCNDFTRWVSGKIGAPGQVLSGLNLSLANNYPGRDGSWIDANDPDNWDLRPQPGDFFSMNRSGQKWGHVGIVYDFDNYAQTWRVVHGGQGKGGSKSDYILWNEPNRPFPWAEVNGWVDIVLFTYGQETVDDPGF
ncbi:MAG: CHAP domain-containing protein [Deltaproteobacteria bacterium]|nr:CHAP domain-containing protein [Deltaproteobacteria bacterium]